MNPDYDKRISENIEAQDAYMMKRDYNRPDVSGCKGTNAAGDVFESKPFFDKAKGCRQTAVEMAGKTSTDTQFKGCGKYEKRVSAFNSMGWVIPPNLDPELTPEWIWLHEALFGIDDENTAFTEIARSKNWWDDDTEVWCTSRDLQIESPNRVEKYLSESKPIQ